MHRSLTISSSWDPVVQRVRALCSRCGRDRGFFLMLRVVQCHDMKAMSRGWVLKVRSVSELVAQGSAHEACRLISTPAHLGSTNDCNLYITLLDSCQSLFWRAIGSNHEVAFSPCLKQESSSHRYLTPAVSFAHFGARLNRSVTYHAPGNQFERFREFLELISRFEFEFCRRENFFFLNDSNIWCVHVNVPWPVCAHAIPFRMLWLPRFMMTEIYISMKPLWKVENIYMCAYTYTFTHLHLHLHLHININIYLHYTHIHYALYTYTYTNTRALYTVHLHCTLTLRGTLTLTLTLALALTLTLTLTLYTCVTLTLYTYTYMYTYSVTYTYKHMHTHLHIYTYTHIHKYTCMYMCVCVCVCEGEGEGEGGGEGSGVGWVGEYVLVCVVCVRVCVCVWVVVCCVLCPSR